MSTGPGIEENIRCLLATMSIRNAAWPKPDLRRVPDDPQVPPGRSTGL